jgi:hypothetical protein
LLEKSSVTFGCFDHGSSLVPARNPANESGGGRIQSGQNLNHPSTQSGKMTNALPIARKPELTVVHDEYDYPSTAKCSSCGKAMPVRQSWITSSAENLAWFADQFRIHVEKEHSGWSGALIESVRLKDTEAA